MEEEEGGKREREGERREKEGKGRIRGRGRGRGKERKGSREGGGGGKGEGVLVRRTITRHIYSTELTRYRVGVRANLKQTSSATDQPPQLQLFVLSLC